MASICRLCQNETRLCKSHIIPEFLFAPVYDDKHRMLVLDTKVGIQDWAQKGFRELLLCKQCESMLNHNYETYFSSQIVDKKIIPDRFSRPIHKFHYHGISYIPYKLFLLSVFWRMIVSESTPFKQAANQNFEPVLREMIIKGQPGNEEKFPIRGAVVIDKRDNAVMKSLLITPIEFHIQDIPVIACLLDGVYWVLFLTETGLPKLSSIHKNGSLELNIKDFTEIATLSNGFQSYLEKENTRLHKQ